MVEVVVGVFLPVDGGSKLLGAKGHWGQAVSLNYFRIIDLLFLFLVTLKLLPPLPPKD